MDGWPGLFPFRFSHETPGQGGQVAHLFSFRFFGSCFGTRNCGCRTLRGFRRVRFFHAAINLGLLTFRFSKHIRWKQPVHLHFSVLPKYVNVSGGIVKRTLRKPRLLRNYYGQREDDGMMQLREETAGCPAS